MGTFADMCTLLLTFFVLLLTFASMDVQKFKEMLGSVHQAFGVQTQQFGEYQPTKPPETKDVGKSHMAMPVQPQIQLSDRETAEAQKMASQIKDLVAASGMGKDVSVSAGSRGVRMRVKGQLLFDAGQATVKPEAKRLLDAVVKVMKKFNFYLTVEGHTDSRPISTSKFPSNWELSSARASAVLRYLLQMGVPNRRVSAVGYAANYPLASNQSAHGRDMNRRVEFVLTKKPLRVGVE